MAETKFSEFTPKTSPSLSDQVVGLSSADNARYTLQSIYDLFQAQIVDSDPLPVGYPAKVMYFDPDDSKWGASSTVVTDGNVLSIGNLTPQSDTLVNIESYDDSYNLLLNAYTKTSGDAITKTLAYTNRGLLCVTDGGVPANIDTPTNTMNYGMWVEKGIVAHGNIYVNAINDSKVNFGDINGVNGAFSEKANINYNNIGDYLSMTIKGNDFLRLKSNSLADIFTLGSTSPIFLMGHNIASADSTSNTTQTLFNVSKSYQQDNMNMCVVGNCDTTVSDRVIFRVQRGDYPKQETVDASKIMIDFLNNGRILTKNLPTSAIGLPTGTWWNNSGVLSIAP